MSDELRRWEDGSGDPGALAGRAADLVDAARVHAPLPAEMLARVRAAALAGTAPRRAPLPLSLRLAVLGAILLASVATAKGGMLLWRKHVEAEAARAEVVRHHASARPKPAARVEPPAPAPVVVETPPPAAKPVHRRVALSAPAEEAAPAPATEGQVLAKALAKLRQAHDPKGALALLDRYDRDFPHGVLASEARETRLEAAVALGDRKTALSILDGLDLGLGRLGAQQRLLRAELRASAGRYRDALADFDVLLPAGAAPRATDVERALYDRAVCLGHLGLDARARADLVEYQKRFPAGPHAGEVARLLEGARL